MSDFIKALRKHLDNLTEEEKEEIRKELMEDEPPKGWLSIEEYLPSWKAVDFLKGYSEYLVKNKYGKEFKSKVTDHDLWYYEAKEIGITHWFNK